MKIFRDGVCYVNFKDLVGFEFPPNLSFDKIDYKEDDYVKLTEPKDIEYIRKRDDIIDYDTVFFLSEEELTRKINELERKLDPYYRKVNALLGSERISLLKNKKFKKVFFKLDKKYYDLINYKNNKKFVDEQVFALLNGDPLERKLQP